jgi:hypothetical protein
MSLDGRAYDRAWNAGARHGVRSQAVAVAHEHRAAELCRALGISRTDGRMLLEQARHDARVVHFDLSSTEQRAIAAKRLARLLLSGLLERCAKAHTP